MRSTVVFAAGALALAISGPVSAQDFTLHADLFGQKQPAPKPPAVDWSRGSAPDQNTEAKPSVVCGMTLVPADPRVDPKMRVTAPDARVAYAMKVVPPTVCKAP
jgi:hypothetical protein